MTILEAGAPTKGKYVGPGWSEWLLGLASTVLLASQLQVRKGADDFLSAQHYYFLERNVFLLQNLALTTNFAVILCVTFWIFQSQFRAVLEPALAGLAFIAIVLVWVEISHAVHLQGHTLYRLNELPFHPVANSGLVGSTIFGGYLLSKIPEGHETPWVTWLIKLAYIGGLFCLQLVAFELLLNNHA